MIFLELQDPNLDIIGANGIKVGMNAAWMMLNIMLLLRFGISNICSEIFVMGLLYGMNVHGCFLVFISIGKPPPQDSFKIGPCGENGKMNKWFS